MKSLDDWNGNQIELAESAHGVLAFIDPLGGLLKGNISPWPTPQIIQKIYKSRQQRAYKGGDLDGVTECLGYYCDLQSVHSEDAITWSVFGPISYAEPELRREFCQKLFSIIDASLPKPETANVTLWRRIPHPDSLAPGGPEIDFTIQSGDVLIFGEAKWRSSVGAKQGVNRIKDQITLRREFFEKFGQVLFPGITHYVVLGASLAAPVVMRDDLQLPNGQILLRDVSWDELCRISPHPLSDELPRYYEWKKANSKTC